MDIGELYYTLRDIKDEANAATATKIAKLIERLKAEGLSTTQKLKVVTLS